MADPNDPTSSQWSNFFHTQVLPLAEEMAFRAYLEQHRVVPTASIQDLSAHYDQFCAVWEPGHGVDRRRRSA